MTFYEVLFRVIQSAGIELPGSTVYCHLNGGWLYYTHFLYLWALCPDFGYVTIFISRYLCTNIVILLLYTFVSGGIIGLGQIKFTTATDTVLPHRNTKRQTHIFQIYHCLVCWKSHLGRRILRRRQMPPKSWFTSLVERYMECVARWNEFELTI